jgi:Asp-tRNA(Asn)/Glu-tRNA(Gln) amidotransferase A subunit family amidase
MDIEATTVNLLSATAIELAQAYRARTLSPVEATKAILKAIPDFESLNVCLAA